MEYLGLSVAGPQSRAVLQKLVDQDLSTVVQGGLAQAHVFGTMAIDISFAAPFARRSL